MKRVVRNKADLGLRAPRVYLSAMHDRSHLLTELRLPESMSLDAMSVADAVALMNRQDMLAVQAVGAVQADIARGVELVSAPLGPVGEPPS